MDLARGRERARRACRDRQDLHPQRRPRGLADFGQRRIIGVAPSARAARELADGARIDAFTFPRFQLHQAASLAAGDVVIVDEAGMAATVDLHRIITQARHVGAQVILVGDHHQLPEIGAGGVFSAAVDLLGADAAELTINRRQQAEWEHAALDELRHGNPHAGFRAYHDHGHVTIATTTAEVHQAAVAAWADAHRAGVNGILLAGTRSEAKALNRLARQQVADELSAACWRFAAASSKPATASSCCATAPTPPDTSTSATGARHGSTTG